MLGAYGAAGAVLADAILDKRFALAGRAPALQVGLVLFTEIPEGGEHRVRRGLAEAAQTSLRDLWRELFELLQMLAGGLAGAEQLQQFEHPFGANAAEGAFAARLVLRELEEIPRDIHHASGVIEHDHAAGTHDGANFTQGFVVHWRIGQARRYAAAGGPAHLYRFKRAPWRGAAPTPLHALPARGVPG